MLYDKQILLNLDFFFLLVLFEFIINLWNVIVIKGENVILRCKVYGNFVLDVKWIKDEKYILGNERMIVFDFGVNILSLIIIDIVLGDMG